MEEATYFKLRTKKKQLRRNCMGVFKEETNFINFNCFNFFDLLIFLRKLCLYETIVYIKFLCQGKWKTDVFSP